MHSCATSIDVKNVPHTRASKSEVFFVSQQVCTKAWVDCYLYARQPDNKRVTKSHNFDGSKFYISTDAAARGDKPAKFYFAYIAIWEIFLRERC